uniref:Uncharacterized protein n=1 Tax=Avena sativa TaxID=4498 RepID=A0ACD6A1Q2_AVESA
MKAALWISWSDDNPGRRYYKCGRSRQHGGCDFFGWHDRELVDDLLKQILVDLRDEVWKLKRVNQENGTVGEEFRKVGDACTNYHRVEELQTTRDRVASMEEAISRKDIEIVQLKKKVEHHLFLFFIACFITFTVYSVIHT